MAREGKLEDAEHQLSFFELDENDPWYQAVALNIAWLAASTNREQAQALRNKIARHLPARQTQPTGSALHTLLRRLDEELSGSPQKDDGHWEFCATCGKVLREVLQLHAPYPYDHYRNHSLWNVVAWIIECCKDTGLVKKWTRELTQIALPLTHHSSGTR